MKFDNKIQQIMSEIFSNSSDVYIIRGPIDYWGHNDGSLLCYEFDVTDVNEPHTITLRFKKWEFYEDSVNKIPNIPEDIRHYLSKEGILKSYIVSFETKDTDIRNMSNKADSKNFKIFNTITHALRKFIEQFKPDALVYNLFFDDVDSDSKREKIYQRILSKQIHHPYTYFPKGIPDGIENASHTFIYNKEIINGK